MIHKHIGRQTLTHIKINLKGKESYISLAAVINMKAQVEEPSNKTDELFIQCVGKKEKYLPGHQRPQFCP